MNNVWKQILHISMFIDTYSSLFLYYISISTYFINFYISIFIYIYRERDLDIEIQSNIDLDVDI